MAKTILVAVLCAPLIAAAWLRLEARHVGGAGLAWLLVVAVLPALAHTARTRAVGAATAALGAGAYLAKVSFLDARPFDGERDFVGPVVSRVVRGALEYYDVPVPFDPFQHPRMHAALLFAIFAFTLAFALAVAARRPVSAAAVLVVGVGWPGTLAPGGDAPRLGVVLVGAVLVLFAVLHARGLVPIPQAVPLGILLVVVAAAVSGSPAVAKGAFLNWETWDLYTRPDKPVNVQFVWNSNYDGIRFPPRVTTVLEAKAPPVSLYWRATTLDNFDGDHWLESLEPIRPGDLEAEPLDDPLLPPRARNEKLWIESRVTVKALEDDHLAAASIPVRYRLDDGGDVVYRSGGIALAPNGVPPGYHYTAWSYAARPSPVQLARSPARYPAALRRYLVVWGRTNVHVPPFGSPDRDERLRRIFLQNLELQPYALLYDRAREIVRSTESPYAAAVAIENWLRVTGGFAYDEHPPQFATVPPLVGFVAESKRGYCQHYAGAMALMLRYLGIPARVAVGFTSGKYKDGKWTVTDHDAHAWVEVWFKGLGWLPFDPTPGRGFLSATYSSSSPFFNIAGVTAALGGLGEAFDIKRDTSFGRGGSAGGASGFVADPARPGEGGPGRGATGSGSLLAVLAAIVASVAAVLGLAKLGRRRLRYLRRDPRRVAAACRRELADFLADQRLDTPSSSTVVDLCALVDAELGIRADGFALAATEARFGPAEGATAAALRARAELRSLLRRVRRELTLWERTRGLLSVRSLAPAP